MNRDPDPYRLYAVVRDDLEMDRGKIAAQAGHAYLDAFLQAQEQDPEIIPLYKENHGIKVTLAAKNLEQLLACAQRAEDAGVPFRIITDLGYTQFEGQETITAVGIGPMKKEQAKPICGRLRLMR